MTQLQPGVRDRMESPNDGQVTLLVGLTATTETNLEELEEVVEDVEEVLPYNLVAVSIAEADLRTLCEMEIIETVEFEGEGYQMDLNGDDTGNLKSPAASTL